MALLELRIKGSHPSPNGWKLTHNPNFSRDLYFAKYRIDMIGSKKIKKIVNEMIGLLYPDTSFIEEKYKPSTRIDEPDARWAAFTDKCDRELKPAIQEELESWWPLDQHPNQEEAN